METEQDALDAIRDLQLCGQKTLYINILRKLPHSDREVRNAIKNLKRMKIIDHDDNDQYFIV